jgi:dephospho-CoA kinase
MLRMGESRIVIGVAGRIGSGKSFAAHYLEQHFGFQYLRYSLVLADWFKADPTVKSRLQEVGWGVMSGDRQGELNRRLIALIDRKSDCAVDGLRHRIDYESLRSEFASQFSKFSLIYIDTPPEIRFERVHDRYQTYDEFLAADSHPVESNIDALVPLASAVLPGVLPSEQLGVEINRFVEAFRSGEGM